MRASTLRTALDHYLAVRRAVGFKLTRDGLLLAQFVSFCDQAGAERITHDVAVAWVTTPPKASPSWLGMRLCVVRSFAAWMQATDPATEIPEQGWLPPRRRTSPFLYTDDEIGALMAAARNARWPLSAATYETLIGVLAVTGMRVGEAIHLDRDDVALDDGVITIRDAKLGKTRQVLAQPTTVEALRRYLATRSVLSPFPHEPALFVHPAGNRITYRSVCPMFHTLCGRADITPRSAACRPTIHGLRHTFAVNTLVGWYRDGGDVQARLPLLSTWLGHTDPKWTYWYLSSTPELLDLACQRLEPTTRSPQ